MLKFWKLNTCYTVGTKTKINLKIVAAIKDSEKIWNIWSSTAMVSILFKASRRSFWLS